MEESTTSLANKMEYKIDNDPPGTNKPSCSGVSTPSLVFNQHRATFSKHDFSISVNDGATSNVCTFEFNAAETHSPANATGSTPAYNWFKNNGDDERTDVCKMVVTASLNCRSLHAGSWCSKVIPTPASENIARMLSGVFINTTGSSPIFTD